ncbi:MAG TPA: hypothetical protein VFU60_15620 [Ktedonobacterales bacterium]|nr:hypothetical protein [Ktedonobacterales bacterium]
MSGQPVRDFGSILNSLDNGPSAPAVVSYTIHWHGVRRRRHVHTEALHVAGLFLDTHATIEWTGHNSATGFTFTADTSGQTVVSAQIGHERNGVFFD